MTRRILVTSALPYANGSIHLGHLVEYIQTDIWVRFQKMRGADCRYMCADDTHGTPIMLSARARGIPPEELIAAMHAEHAADFRDFLVGFDNYDSTNSDENRQFAELIYTRLRDRGHVETRTIEQLYCEHDRMFLPDRMVRGTCPVCGAPDQYGDSCEVCGATYNPVDLRDAGCALCKARPVLRSSEHHFFRLGHFTDFLRAWVAEDDHVQPQIRHKLEEWFQEGLRDWDISRDAPYFGFRIPGTEDKFFYVWLDAPVGYIAATRRWAERNGRSWEEFWLDPSTELVHFIGKDIVYFHCLFWPAMLKGADFRPPDRVFVHGFLTVDGQKMSKSRGTFIKARTYLDHLGPEYLRYYYASKLSDRVDDLDLNLEDFVARVNADLVNRLANLGSRTVNFLQRKLDGRVGSIDPAAEPMLWAVEDGAGVVAGHYEARRFSQAIREVMRLVDEANLYLTQAEPWKVLRDDPSRARSICTAGVTLFFRLVTMLRPVLPALADRVAAMVGEDSASWDRVTARIEHRPVGEFGNLVERIQQEAVDAMIEDGRGTTDGTSTTPEVKAREGAEPLAPVITYDEFMKLDIRVGVVVAAEGVEGADKLLRLQVDLGELGRRQIFAGIKKSHAPEVLLGRRVLVAANLAPRKMRFGLSEGMVLAAGPGDADIHMVEAEGGALAGDRVR
ncbi:MAG: methionine--tRNA ligase [Deltaproteobacteria bacterium]|nr:methionine--tRNA ligase [Deltaproteobacteria bacterium]